MDGGRGRAADAALALGRVIPARLLLAGGGQVPQEGGGAPEEPHLLHRGLCRASGRRWPPQGCRDGTFLGPQGPLERKVSPTPEHKTHGLLRHHS